MGLFKKIKRRAKRVVKNVVRSNKRAASRTSRPFRKAFRKAAKGVVRRSRKGPFTSAVKFARKTLRRGRKADSFRKTRRAIKGKARRK